MTGKEEQQSGREKVAAVETFIPSREVSTHLAVAASNLRIHIESKKPDFLITLGGSSIITRIVLHLINKRLSSKIPVLRVTAMEGRRRLNLPGVGCPGESM